MKKPCKKASPRLAHKQLPMLSGRIRILNFDNSVAKETQLLQQFNPAIVDLTKIGPSSRLWVDQKSADEIRKSLQPEYRNAITFLGSGDFHHVSNLLLEQFLEPLTVIVFDAHPDWDILPPKAGCGAWVSRILERPNISKVILLGVSSNDIRLPSIMTGNLRHLKDHRLEIYPFFSQQSRVFLRAVPPNRSYEVQRGFCSSIIAWKGIKGKNLADFFSEQLMNIPTREVYVSIDKDCLTSEAALTNWEAGRLSPGELLALLNLIQKHLSIVGLDIAGDYSPPFISGKFKSFCSFLDHPRNYTARHKDQAEIRRLNEGTNLAILQALGF